MENIIQQLLSEYIGSEYRLNYVEMEKDKLKKMKKSEQKGLYDRNPHDTTPTGGLLGYLQAVAPEGVFQRLLDAGVIRSDGSKILSLEDVYRYLAIQQILLLQAPVKDQLTPEKVVRYLSKLHANPYSALPAVSGIMTESFWVNRMNAIAKYKNSYIKEAIHQ